ncbi:type II secretion system F family protein [Salinibacterium sp. G-O1]|uniref:type II secretion system F family protein n=1 Tax=Salinibacterium sp. G-O1 TaxID=3046208 RepID=UPI0024BB5F14|nr:type II secretion system F family protein [Salinibacterium sp. G-O1]MDJ0334573.1 type II secretion system F family protein [Salinibacterium sp. G-O1]
MSALLGLLLGAGAILMISPALWPRGAREPRPSAIVARQRERLVQAGLARISPATVFTVAALMAVVSTSLVFALFSVVVLAIATGVVAFLLPFLLIGWRARAQRKLNRVVWPDVVDQLVSAVRSGLALPDSVMTLASTGPSATRAQFAVFAAEYRATGNFASCLDALKSRLADPVADRILETLRMSREVGGSELTTVLRNLSAYLRQESAIRSEVEARQSWVMNAARLGVASPWVVLLLLATRPEAAAAYNSPGGATLIVVGLVVSFFAYRLMIGIGRIPDEPRWFA